jgi:hypothetical protein
MVMLPVGHMSIVRPSGAARAAASAAIMPLAPARFSTSTGWPRPGRRQPSATSRAIRSPVPPAAKPTRMRAGRSGAQAAGGRGGAVLRLLRSDRGGDQRREGEAEQDAATGHGGGSSLSGGSLGAAAGAQQGPSGTGPPVLSRFTGGAFGASPAPPLLGGEAGICG